MTDKIRSLYNKGLSAGKSLMQKGAGHIFIGSFLTKFVAFFSSIFLARVMSKFQNGILAYYDNLLGYFQVFMGLGLGYSILRYTVLGEDIKKKYSYYRYSILRGSKFNIVLFGIAILFTLLYSFKPSYAPYKWLLVLMVAIIPMKFLEESVLHCQRAMFDSKRYAVCAFIVSSMWVICRFLGGWSFGVWGVVAFSFVAEYAMVLYLLRNTNKRYFDKIEYVPPTKEEQKEVNVFAFQYMLTNSLWAIFMLNDIFLLGNLIDNPGMLAEYKFAYVMPANLAIIASSIGIFTGPYFTKREHEGNLDWVRKNWIKILSITAALIAAAALILFILSRPIILLLYGEEYIGSVKIMRILLVAAFFNSGLRFTTAHALSSMGEVKYNMIVSASAVIIQVVTNIFVIPRYGAVGVACTSVMVYFLMAVSLAAIFYIKYFVKAKDRKATE